MPHRRLFQVFLSLAMILGISGQALADTVINGKFGPGALYRLVRPTSWNGTLLVYAHGYVASDAPIAIPPDAELIASLLAPQGFAVAFSSFSENGWAVKDGAQRTHQLLGIFTSKFGAPTRVYIGGASMGGLIAIKLTETYPGRFVGALPACAVAGGARRHFDYQGNTRVLFDFFYPGVLPGSAGNIPPGIDVTQAIVLPAIAAMTGNPAGAFAIASIDQTPIPFSTGPELLESIATALAGNASTFPNLLDLTHGHPFFDNSATQYTGSLPPVLLQAINAGVQRFTASPSALNYLAHYYEPSGDLRNPTLTLSTSRDPVVPGFNQIAYGNAVAAAGQSDRLVQRSITRYGHCTFSPAEITSAFSDLVLWVEYGIKPTP